MTCYRCRRPANADSGLCCGCEDRKRDEEDELLDRAPPSDPRETRDD